MGEENRIFAQKEFLRQAQLNLALTRAKICRKVANSIFQKEEMNESSVSQLIDALEAGVNIFSEEEIGLELSAAKLTNSMSFASSGNQ